MEELKTRQETDLKEVVFKRKKEYDEFSQLFKLRYMTNEALIWWGELFTFRAEQLREGIKARSLDARA